VFAGHDSRGAQVVAADFALGELVEEPLAFFVERFGRYNLAAQVAEIVEPVAGVEGELSVDVFADLLSEGRAGSGGRDGDLEVTATDDRREVEVAEGRVVDGVAEDVLFRSFVVDGAVDGGDVGGGYDEELAGEVAGSVLALMPHDLACGRKAGDAFGGGWSDDRYLCVGGLQGFDLGLSQMAAANDDTGAGSDFQEDWEEVHGGSLLMIAGVAPELRSFAGSGSYPAGVRV